MEILDDDAAQDLLRGVVHQARNDARRGSVEAAAFLVDAIDGNFDVATLRALGLNPALHRRTRADAARAERLDRGRATAAALGLNPNARVYSEDQLLEIEREGQQ